MRVEVSGDGPWRTYSEIIDGRRALSVDAMVEEGDPDAPWDVLVHIVTDDAGAVIIPYDVLKVVCDDAGEVVRHRYVHDGGTERWTGSS